MWNSTAKQLQKIYYEKYKIKFNPFSDVEFATARAARDAKRKELQRDPLKRKVSASAYNLVTNTKKILKCEMKILQMD